MTYRTFALVIFLIAAACLITGIVLLSEPADEKNRRGCRVMIAILLLLFALGLGVCGGVLRELGQAYLLRAHRRRTAVG